MKVGLIVVPFAENDSWDFGVFGKSAKRVWTIGAPLGPCYVAAAARDAGADVEIIDCMARNLNSDSLVSLLSAKKFDILGISSVSSGYKDAVRVAEIVKKNHRQTIVILGGAHAIAMHKIGKVKSLLENKNFDIICFGEGEEVIKAIIQSVMRQKDFAHIKGVAWRKNGNILQNVDAAPITDLDKVSFPAVDLLKGGYYRRSPSSKKREPVFSVITTRGCPYDCIFCNKIFGRQVRRRSIGNVIEEIKLAKEKMGAREIRFWDETFTLNKNFVVGLCKAIIQERVNLPWSCNGHINTLDEETLSWMKTAGCWEIDFGIEGGTDKVLQLIKKGITVEQVKRDVAMVKKCGIEVRTFFILGLPGDTKASINASINLAIEVDSDYSTFYLPQVYPGARLFDITLKETQFTEEDILTALREDRVFYYPNQIIEHGELINLVRAAHKRFYHRLSYIIGRLKKIESLEDIKRYLSAGWAVFRF